MKAPRTWVLPSQQAGDNVQLFALAEALGWPFRVVRMRYGRRRRFASVLSLATLQGVDLVRSDPLEPPWPELALVAGRSSEPVARWIRAQSGGLTRIVRLGRSWNSIKGLDLVVLGPQWRIPPENNVLRISQVLNPIDEDTMRKAREKWEDRFSTLPRPWVGFLVGGDSGAFRFREEDSRALLGSVLDFSRKRACSLLISTSARTPASFRRLLEKGVDVPSYCYFWGDTEENPYLGYLACADELIVTSESISMLSESSATRKLLHIYPIGELAWKLGRMQGHHYARKTARLLHWLQTSLTPQHLYRDFESLSRTLVDSGRAVWLGEDKPEGWQSAPFPSDMQKVVTAVRTLVDMR